MERSSGRTVRILSQRRIRQDVSRCSGYEFEDLVAELEGAEVIAPGPTPARPWLHRGRRWLSKRTSLFEHLPAGVDRMPLDAPVDLFCCTVQKPVELLDLDAVPDWRRKSGLAVCVIEEMWNETEDFLPLIRSLRRFDLIACAFADALQPLRRATGRPVIHLPGAADLLRFAPVTPIPERVIDLYYMGRRRPDLHAALVPRLRQRNAFYHYDSASRPPIAADPALHREVLANLLQRSRLFVVDIAKIGHADRKGHEAWGPRHVEGMAGGAVQVGYTPASVDFRAHFDWPEAVLRLPADGKAAADAICALLDDPAEIDRRRAVNFAQAFRRHDWMHRWALILDHFGLAPTPQFDSRRARLNMAAAQWAPDPSPHLRSVIA